MKILHLEDTPSDAHFIRELLADELPLCEITLVTNAPEYLSALQQRRFDLILSDFRLKDIDGLQALELARENAPETPFIFLSGSIGEEIALQCVRAGAHDYVLKDRIKRLPTAIRHAVDEAKERQHRQAAEEAQGRLVDVLENTPDFVGMAAPDGRMLYINRAGLRLTNLAETTDVAKLLMHDFHPPQFSSSLSDAFAEATRIGTWSGETLLLTRDGQNIPVSQVVIAHRSTDTGNIEYFSTIMRDLSAQRAAQRRLREQADLLDKARDAIIVTDPEGVFTFWNQGAEHIFGWSADEILGRTLTAEVLPADSHEEVNRAREAVEETGEWQGELRLFNKARQPIVIETSITTIYDETGLPSAHLTISTDITEKKKLQEQFFRAQRVESIGLLAAGIAHDLNNVLTPMLLAAPLLRESAASPGDREMLVALEESVQRGAALVRQILGFVRGVSGPSQEIQIQPLLHAIANIINGTFPKNIRLEENIPPHLPTIKANPTQIHQVLLNLAVNARDAMPIGGVIRLKAEHQVIDETAARSIPGAHTGSYLAIHVEDTGSGIPQEILNNIWEPFFTTKEENKGTGLGLSTVRGIVESHGGFITLKTALGVGTTFSVYLRDSQNVASGSANPVSFNAPRGTGELILVVDDEAQIRELAALTLARHGYRVLAARDGTEAVALFTPRATEIKLIVTDLHMPNLGGVALAGVARRQNPDVRIVVTSGMSEEVNEDPTATSRLVNAFLPKPFTIESLLAAVHEQLKPAKPR